MQPKHKQKSSVPQAGATLEATTQYINKIAALTVFEEDSDNAPVFVSIRYLYHEFQCFSIWHPDEMKAFWEFIRKVHQYTWTMLKQSGGKGENKAGMGFTPIPVGSYPANLTTDIEPDSKLFELRVTQRARVHCFRAKSICYLYLLDKDHSIFP
ncbi:hypothetical protein [Ferruginibacter profundus]